MNVATFWELMDQTRLASGNDPVRQAELLTDALIQYAVEDILACKSIFSDLMDQAYVASLWDVASIIGCGCGDDGFTDFRAWLIGQGQDVFRKALVDPESLVEVVEPGQEELAGSGTLWAAFYLAWERKGLAFENMPKRVKPLPKLKGHTHDESTALALYPRAAARFWKRCLELAAEAGS